MLFGTYLPSTVILNTCVFHFTPSAACLAEYTTIGTLFGTYLGTKSWVINIIVGERQQVLHPADRIAYWRSCSQQ